jgi:hypothetical protein
MLAKDRILPADIRMSIARKISAVGPQLVGSKRTPSAKKGGKIKLAGPPAEHPGMVKPTNLEILFGVVIDTTAHAHLRRKAALAIAQHFKQKKPAAKRWWKNAPTDEYGFSINPQIAAEYRDTKMELRRLERSGGNSPATTRRRAKMQDRLKAILNRLRCPCPSLYGIGQLANDLNRIVYFLEQRDANATLSKKDNAEEAHLRARSDAFLGGPESAARHHLSLLRHKERRFRRRQGARLSWKEQVDLRLLRLLYPPPPPPSDQDNRFYELDYELLRHEPLAKDGNLYPPASKLRPLEGGNIVEEYVDVLPCVCGNPT